MLNAGKSQLDKGKKELDGYKSQLDAGQKAIDDARSQLATARTQTADGIRDLRNNIPQLESSISSVQAGITNYEESLANETDPDEIARLEELIEEQKKKKADLEKDLLGIPLRITVGRRAGEGIVEVKRRDSADTAEITVDEAINLAKEI